MIFSCFNKAPNEDSKFLLQKRSVQKGFSCLHNARFKFIQRHKFKTATETFEEKSREIIVRNKIVDLWYKSLVKMSFSIENCRFKWKISTVHWKSTFATGKSSKKVCESEFKWVKRGENCKSSSNWCQMLLRHYACGWLNLRFSHVNFCFFHFSLSQAESSFNPFFRFWAHLLQLGLGHSITTLT